jgi:hypothetical protein
MTTTQCTQAAEAVLGLAVARDTVDVRAERRRSVPLSGRRRYRRGRWGAGSTQEGG